jgi:uncharacterized protein
VSAATIAALVLVGLLAGVIAGLLGVGGGIVFVPGLVIVLGLSQHVAEGTSLLAILPVVIAGAISQRRYGNVRAKDALLIGVLSLGGAAAGVVLANALSGKALQIAFAVLMVLIAAQLLRRALRER